MKLFQALKEKKKIASEIAMLKHRVSENNSFVKGNEQDYSAKDTLELIFKKESELVNLKVKIQVANQPIMDKIFRLAELKGRAQFLKSVPTNKGVVKNRYSDEAVEYTVEVQKTELDELINQATAEIYAIQDELDIYNHTTDI